MEDFRQISAPQFVHQRLSSLILIGSFSCGNADHDGGLRGGTGVPGKRLTWPWKRKAAQSFHDCPLKDGHQAPYVARAGNRNHRLDVGRSFARKRVAEKSPAGRGVRATYKIRKALASRPASHSLDLTLSLSKGQWPDRKRGVAMERRVSKNLLRGEGRRIHLWRHPH